MTDGPGASPMSSEGPLYRAQDTGQPLNNTYVSYVAGRFWRLVEVTILHPSPGPWLKLMGTLIVLTGIYWVLSG